MKKDTIATLADLEGMIEGTGMKKERFASMFGLKMPQLISWKRIGRISKRGYQVLFTLIARNPHLILELPAINAEIESREKRPRKPKK